MPRSAAHLVQHQFKKKEVAPTQMPPAMAAKTAMAQPTMPAKTSFIQQKFALAKPKISHTGPVGAAPAAKKKSPAGLMPSRFGFGS